LTSTDALVRWTGPFGDFSWNYHNQLDPAWTSQPGVFAFRDVIQPVKSLADFGAVLAAHPLVAQGWVQKLCYYVNSAACDEGAPEFRRLVALFRSSGHSWRALVKALVTSSLTTHAADTQAAQESGETVAVARRDHLCAALDARLGFSDVCGLDALGQRGTTTISEIVSGLPSDAYGRGSVAPILPSDPSLFFAAGTENICEAVAEQLIDAPAGSQVDRSPLRKHGSSSDPDGAIADFVGEVMALTPSDSRSAGAQNVLKSHFISALEQPGTTATDALRSTFIVACQAPSAISLGL